MRTSTSLLLPLAARADNTPGVSTGFPSGGGLHWRRRETFRSALQRIRLGAASFWTEASQFALARVALCRPRYMLRALLLMVVTFQVLPARATTWLWAWDRAEDLRWLADGSGVAYFAIQFDARGRAFVPTWRRAPMRVPAHTRLLPVLHIEAFHARHPAVLDEAAVALWSEQLASAIRRLAVPRVQIDFEARSSQRNFYREVLVALRSKLPPGVTLSVTALASWCGDARWLSSLPVDEVVPMYFRMGPAERTLWRRRLVEPAELPPVCRVAAGVSTDEWPALVDELGLSRLAGLHRRQLYVFTPTAWRAGRLDALPGWPSGSIPVPK